MVVFFICSLINVCLSTVKTVFTSKAKNKMTTALINAVAYGFNALVLKQLTTYDATITVFVAIITNIIGVYLSLLFIEKTQKDDIWKFSITSRERLELLDKFNLPYTCNDIVCGDKKYYNYTVISVDKTDSNTIMGILKENAVKYDITQVNGRG